MRVTEALLAFGLATCDACLELPGPAFTSASEQHWLRIDAARDTVEFFSLHRGLTPGEGDVLLQLRAVLGGRRIFPPGGGFLTWDFDEPPEPDEIAESDPQTLELHRLAASLDVTAAGLSLDASGSVCLWRKVRIERASDCLRWAESAALRGPGPHFPIGEFPAFDARSSELQEAAWRRGERFWSLEGDSLRLDLPSTGENAARVLAHVLENALAGTGWEGDPWTQFGVSLRDVEIAGERMRLRLGPDESGWMRVGWVDSEPEQAGDPAPFDAETLRAAGFEVETYEALAARVPGVKR